MQNRSRRNTRKDSLGPDEFAYAADGITRPDRKPGVDERGVIQLGHETFVEIAQSIDEFAVARFGRDDADIGFVFAEEPADAHERSGRAKAADEVGDFGKVGEDFGTGRLVVCIGVGGVAVLIEHDPIGVLGRDAPGDADSFIGAAGSRRGDDLGAPHVEQLAPFDRRVLRHHADEAITAKFGDHGQRNAGVSARRFEDRAAGTKPAFLLGTIDHAERRAVLDGSSGIAVFHFRPQTDVRRRRQCWESDERRVADRFDQGVITHGRRPALRRRPRQLPGG